MNNNHQSGEDEGINNGQPYIPPFIRQRMPGATETEIQEAAESLRRYLKVLYRIYLDRKQRGVCTRCGLPKNGGKLI